MKFSNVINLAQSAWNKFTGGKDFGAEFKAGAQQASRDHTNVALGIKPKSGPVNSAQNLNDAFHSSAANALGYITKAGQKGFQETLKNTGNLIDTALKEAPKHITPIANGLARDIQTVAMGAASIYVGASAIVGPNQVNANLAQLAENATYAAPQVRQAVEKGSAEALQFAQQFLQQNSGR